MLGYCPIMTFSRYGHCPPSTLSSLTSTVAWQTGFPPHGVFSEDTTSFSSKNIVDKILRIPFNVICSAQSEEVRVILKAVLRRRANLQPRRRNQPLKQRQQRQLNHSKCPVPAQVIIPWQRESIGSRKHTRLLSPLCQMKQMRRMGEHICISISINIIKKFHN